MGNLIIPRGGLLTQDVGPRSGGIQGGAVFPAGAAEKEMMLRRESDDPLGMRGLRRLQDEQEAAGTQMNRGPGRTPALAVDLLGFP